MKVLPIAVFTSLFLATTAFAQKSTVAGYALGTDRQPLQNVNVRIQQQNAKSPAVVVKSNAKGAFVARDLPVGNYTVSLLAGDGGVASAVTVKTKPNETATVNFLPQAPIAAAAPKRRARWVPPPTGSHMGGFEDSKYKTSAQEEGYGGQNVGRLSPAALSRMQSTNQPARQGGQ
jgi:hypothetical protein